MEKLFALPSLCGKTAAILVVAATVVSTAVTVQSGGCWSDVELAGSPHDLELIKGEAAAKYRAAPLELSGALPAAPLPASWRGLIKRVKPERGEKLVALTFDLCEGAGEKSGYDGRIVDYLREKGVPATFFMGGKWARSHRTRALKLLADDLFEVGNHSFSHAHPAKLGREGLESEVLGAQAELETLRGELRKMKCAKAEVGTSPPLFRFPYGESTREALEFVNGSGMVAIQWDVAPGDPARGVSPERLAGEIVRNVKPGSIVVLHANAKGESTAGALAIAVPELVKRGYKFITVGRLLASGEIVRD